MDANATRTEVYRGITCPCSDQSGHTFPIGMTATHFYFFCQQCGIIYKINIPE